MKDMIDTIALFFESRLLIKSTSDRPYASRPDCSTFSDQYIHPFSIYSANHAEMASSLIRCLPSPFRKEIHLFGVASLSIISDVRKKFPISCPIGRCESGARNTPASRVFQSEIHRVLIQLDEKVSVQRRRQRQHCDLDGSPLQSAGWSEVKSGAICGVSLVRFQSQQIWHVKNEVTDSLKKRCWKSECLNDDHFSQFDSPSRVLQSNVFVNSTFSDEAVVFLSQDLFAEPIGVNVEFRVSFPNEPKNGSMEREGNDFHGRIGWQIQDSRLEGNAHSNPEIRIATFPGIFSDISWTANLSLDCVSHKKWWSSSRNFFQFSKWVGGDGSMSLPEI
jgi:hypothetical protein